MVVMYHTQVLLLANRGSVLATTLRTEGEVLTLRLKSRQSFPDILHPCQLTHDLVALSYNFRILRQELSSLSIGVGSS